MTTRLPGLRHQLALWNNRESRFIAMAAGLGSGKTYSIIVKAMLLAYANHPIPGIVAEPDFPMVRKILLRGFKEFCRKYRVWHRWNGQDRIFTVRLDLGEGMRECEIMLEGADPPERLVGPNLAYAILDEAGWHAHDAFKHVRPRVRHPDAKLKQTIVVGTPEGFNWFYDVAEAAPPKNSVLIRACTLDNGFLPPTPQDYVDNELAHLDEEEREQYVNGYFVARGGRVYKHFRRDEHAKPCRNPLDGQIVVGADFNVGYMCWPVGRIVGDELHIWGEVSAKDTNTFEQRDRLLRYLADKMPGYRSMEEIARSVTICIDATGKAQKSSATKSDRAILLEAGFHVRHPSANPAVRDRVASLNDRFRLKRMFVDPEGAPRTLNALIQHGYDEHGAPEKAKHGQGRPQDAHDASNDALGYIVWMQEGWRVTTLKGNQAVRV